MLKGKDIKIYGVKHGRACGEFWLIESPALLYRANRARDRFMGDEAPDVTFHYNARLGIIPGEDEPRVSTHLFAEVCDDHARDNGREYYIPYEEDEEETVVRMAAVAYCGGLLRQRIRETLLSQ